MMPTSREHLRAALSHIPASDRDVWLRMGMAVKSELGDTGFDIWDEWSQGDSSYNENDAKATWKSIKPNGKVTAGSLFYEAKLCGYEMHGANGSRAPDPDALAKRATDRQADEQEQAKKHAQAAAKALALWKVDVPARADHPYLERKKLPPTKTLRELPITDIVRLIGYYPEAKGQPLAGRTLIVPLRNADGLSTLELIDESGRKSALSGGAKSGAFWCNRKMPDGDGGDLTLVVGEGMATALSTGVATGNPAFAAMSCSNLPTVAAALRERYPAAQVVVLADLGNGEKEAHDAAREVRGLVAFPDFGAERKAGEKDFNDAFVRLGAEAVKRDVASARAPDALRRRSAEPNATATDSDGRGVRLVRGDTIKPEVVHWMWDGWLARGKFHVLAGRPGTGKTTLALAIAATITSGGRWPDGARPDPGNVLIWSGEDDPKDTLVPRLLANGAEMARIYFVGDSLDPDGKPVSFDPARHMAALELEAARMGNVKLLLVDPIVSAVQGDGNSNTEVRRALQPIVDLAARLDCAALGISHFTKGSGGRDVVERVTGSLAFGAAPRVVWAAAKIRDEAEQMGRRILVRAKSNNGPDSGGFGYDIKQVQLPDFPEIFASEVLWGEPVEGEARELLRDAEADDGDDGDPRAFLAELLAGGALPANQVFRDAEAHGYSRKQMRTALKRLRGRTFKAGMKDGWRWALPEDAREVTEDAEDAQSASQAPSADTKGAFGEDALCPSEDARHESRAPSAPSAPLVFAWRVTRANGETFDIRAVQGATLAEMREQYPGARVEPAIEAAP